MRRKGERKLEKHWPAWGPEHPIARSMASGSEWFTSWVGQTATPWPIITRKTKIPKDRLWELERGAEPTDAEYELLASLWDCPVEDLRTSHPAGAGKRD